MGVLRWAQLTFHIIPLGTICDAIWEGLCLLSRAVGFASSHDGVMWSISFCQIFEDFIISWFTVNSCEPVRGRVIVGVACHHRAPVEIAREQKPGVGEEREGTKSQTGNIATGSWLQPPNQLFCCFPTQITLSGAPKVWFGLMRQNVHTGRGISSEQVFFLQPKTKPPDSVTDTAMYSC